MSPESPHSEKPGPPDSSPRPSTSDTVTFLMSDVEGSTHIWEASETVAKEAIDLQFRLLHDVIARHGGSLPLEQGEGDSVVGVFSTASDAVVAARDILLETDATAWPTATPLRIRLALHTGEVERRADGNYNGRTIIRCARLRAIAHGGQALLSDATHDLVADRLSADLSFLSLGSHRLKDLGRPERVWQLCHQNLASDFPDLRSLSAERNNLPLQLTSFIGRSAEMNELRNAIHEAKLVTCVGAGGSGKSRLAVQVAADSVDEHPGGTWWIDLSPISDPDRVADAAARTLGIRPEFGRDTVEILAEQLSGQEALLVLDNCEQVVDAAARLVDALLRAAPSITILATSREPLGVPGEIAWRVPSLEEADARSLFEERARQVRPGYTVQPQDAAAVEEVCRRLDGLPLAIELAAAQNRVMHPASIALALDDRFRLLTGGSRTSLARQRTLEASVDWSHELLDETEQTLFRRLSIFAGGFTLESAERICSDELLDGFAVLEVLIRLVDKSLVQAQSGGGDTRYRMLETIRHYAGDRLIAIEDAPRLRRRHFDFFLEMAERAEPELVRVSGSAWLASLEQEHENLQAALEWIDGEGPSELFLRMVTSLALFWELHGHLLTGGLWFGRALTGDDAPSIIRARALWGAAHVALYADDLETAFTRAPQAQAMALEVKDDWAIARSLNTLSYVELWFDPAKARAALARSIELGRAIGDEWAVADGLKMMTIAWLAHGNLDEVAAPLAELLAEAKSTHNKFFLAWCHWVTGFVAIHRGDVVAAEEHLGRSLAYCREVGDPSTGGIVLAFLGALEVLVGRFDTGRAQFEDIRQRADGSRAIGGPHALLYLVDLLIGHGEFDAAREQLGHESMDLPLFQAWARCLEGELELASGRLDAAGPAIAEARSQAATADNPWVLAQVCDVEARVARERGDISRAEGLHHQALALRVAAGERPDIVTSLDQLAGIAVERESPLEAVRLLAATGAFCDQRGVVRRPDRQRAREGSIEAARRLLDAEAFAGALEEGAALSLEDAADYASRARGERGRPSFGWDSLTPTELRVVDLVCEGLTNPQIAARMFVARGTVKAHLGHVFSKLGVATRSELAAESTRRKVGH